MTILDAVDPRHMANIYKSPDSTDIVKRSDVRFVPLLTCARKASCGKQASPFALRK